jgi:diguanylate cyclase (GGDEF)-like protein/PAS domain S-box-containing protein
MSQAEPFLQRIMDHLAEGVFILDAQEKITYWNQGAQKLTGYGRDDVLGKACAEILMCVGEDGAPACGAECRLAQALADREPRQLNLFLRHRDGHRTPVTIDSIPCMDHAGRPLGVIEIIADRSPRMVLLEQMEFLRRTAMYDPLTGLANRAYGEKILHSKLGEMSRGLAGFGLLFADVDEFKTINDTHGHAVGDRVLKMVALTMQKCVRSFDVVCRWGGDEFLLLLTDVDERSFMKVGEKIRAQVEQSSFWVEGNIIRTSLSMGAVLARSTDTPESIIKRADSLLYISKQEGRNRLAFD